jgi:hypothetical protein
MQRLPSLGGPKKSSKSAKLPPKMDPSFRKKRIKHKQYEQSPKIRMAKRHPKQQYKERQSVDQFDSYSNKPINLNYNQI